jgi:hypothetical protein
MRTCRATRAAVSAFLAVGCAGLFSLASAQTTQLAGKFRNHLVQGGPSITTGKGVIPINQSGGAGTFVGTVTLDFPDQTPKGFSDGGTRLVLESPMTTHVTLDITWTPPTQRPGDPNNIFAAGIDAETWGLPEEDFRNAHCGTPSPIPPSGLPLQSGLIANTPYHFSASADCTWTSLPFSPLGAGGSALITSATDLIAFGNSVTIPDGFIADITEFIVSVYEFAAVTADLSVDYIEVVQTVQDVSNSIPRIAGKPTVARVFVKNEDTDLRAPAPRITALLHGFRGTTELPGSPLTPFNQGGAILAKRLFDRASTDDALNFSLPDTWLDQGDLQLVTDINPHRTVAETNYNNNSLTLAVNLLASPIFLVNYVPVCYRDLETCPTNSISALDAMARKLYPVGGIDFLYKPLKTPRWLWPYTLVDAKDASDLLAYLRRRYALLDSSEGVAPDQLAAWLPELNNNFNLGESDPKWLGSTGRVSYEQDSVSKDAAGTPADYRDAAFTLTHEIAHNLGLRHTDKAAASSDDKGDCVSSPGCCAIDPDTDFPFADATIHELGFDTVHKVAVTPSKNDMMSYCSPPGSNIWISPFDYKKLIAGGLRPLARRSEFSAAAPSDYVIVTGSANRDGKGGKINSIDRLTAFAGTEASDPTGNHCLQFSDVAGTILSSHCFTLTFEAENHGQGGVHLPAEAFSIKVPFPAGATKIALVAGSTPLASVTRSAHAPAISITSPSGGAVWSGRNTITWTASDADGDPLVYSVLTSPDNGSTWLPMETDLTATRFTFDTAEISAGNKTLFQVLASDGFNTTAATVGPVTITAQPFLEATPAVDFGVVASGQSSTLPILLTNRGELAVKVTALTFDNARFSAGAALPFSIAPGGSQNVNVSFQPTSAGLKTARLTIVSDDSARSPLTVSLSGTGCVSVGGRPCVSRRTPRALPPRS